MDLWHNAGTEKPGHTLQYCLHSWWTLKQIKLMLANEQTLQAPLTTLWKLWNHDKWLADIKFSINEESEKNQRLPSKSLKMASICYNKSHVRSKLNDIPRVLLLTLKNPELILTICAIRMHIRKRTFRCRPNSSRGQTNPENKAYCFRWCISVELKASNDENYLH
jgi:hypothetical protein